MIEPRLENFRGDAITFARSDSKHRTIVGKVIAPNGLYGLFVNDSKVTVASGLMFQTIISLKDGQTPVQIVALDNAGQRGELAFTIQQSGADRTEEVTASSGVDPGLATNVDFGEYHAVIIGNVDYRNLPRLRTPHNDATELAAVLQRKYGFKTKVLLDATRYQILSALNEMRAKLDENDNLLLYYAGHGELDTVNERGHWLPVDAESGNTANWISNVSVTDILNSMSARKIIVISDSCYSGSLTRSTLARLDAGRSEEAWRTWLQLMVTKKSRTALTSGGVAPVLDGGGGLHSIFAKALINALRENSKILDGQTLHQLIAQGVTYAAQVVRVEQVPQYSPVKFAGHEAGDFFFVPDS
jgi:hypothetical protein